MAWLVAEGPMACSVGQSTAARPCAAIWLATSRGLVLEPTLVTLRACPPGRRMRSQKSEPGLAGSALGSAARRAACWPVRCSRAGGHLPPRLERPPRLEPWPEESGSASPEGVDLVEDERLQVVLGHLEVGGKEEEVKGGGRKGGRGAGSLLLGREGQSEFRKWHAAQEDRA